MPHRQPGQQNDSQQRTEQDVLTQWQTLSVFHFRKPISPTLLSAPLSAHYSLFSPASLRSFLHQVQNSSAHRFYPSPNRRHRHRRKFTRMWPGQPCPFLPSCNLCGSTAPSQNILIDGFGSSSAYKLKSSLTMIGSPGSTFSFPNVRSSDAATRRVSSGSLMVAGTRSGDTSIIGARSAGTPAAAAIPFVIQAIDASTFSR